MIYIIYLILAVLVVVFSTKLAYYVDLLDKTTNLSGAFLGGVMLAAVTSLPELFTSISATVFLGQPELVLGNVLGSNIFNLAILGGLMILLYKKFSRCFVAKSHRAVTIYSLVVFFLVGITIIGKMDIRFLDMSVVSVIILVIYILSVKHMSEDEQDDDKETMTAKLSTKQIMVRFCLFSLALIVVSIFITYATDMIAVKLGLGKTLAGAVLLGVATSLPELSSSISLARMGNFNATTGNIMGSNMFNFIILFLADILYVGGTVYTVNHQSTSLVVFGFISTIVALVALIIKGKMKKQQSTGSSILYIGCGIFIVVSYGLFLMLSM